MRVGTGRDDVSNRRVLIVCYYFPPTPSVGSIRVAALAKHLPQYGWEPAIVTPRSSEPRDLGIEIHETESRDVAAMFKSSVGMETGLALRDLIDAGRPSAWSS